MESGDGEPGASEVGVLMANPQYNPKTLSVPNISREVQAPGCQEKPLLFYMRPYRKPTQVDEERILRPTGEVLLRNSAK